MELIEAMLEETSPQTHHLAKEIAGSLDLAAIYDSIGDFYELMNDREVQRAGFDDEAERGLFRAYHILVHLQDYGNNLGTWGEPTEVFVYCTCGIYQGCVCCTALMRPNQAETVLSAVAYSTCTC